MHLEDKLFHFPDDPGVGLILTVGQDFGDAPTAAQSGFAADYPTVVFANGASHLDAGPRLGPLRDIESDGQPAAGATGDDNDANGDDEDGVAFVGSLAASPTSTTTGSVRVDLQNADGTANRLDAFIDFNQNGSWSDPGEQIFTDFDLGTADGVQVLNFTVPQAMGGSVLLGTTFARFRLSTAGGLSFTGAADDGEVEDLPVAICSTAVTNTNDSGDGSLRAAIQCANAVPGVNTISFNIAGAGPHTIQPQSPLPTITDPVIVDGTTQGVSPTPLVELDGTLAGSGASGLTIGNGGDGSTVRGLTINRFDAEGILISRRDNVLIEDNHLGTDPSGTIDLGNGQSGIHILNGENNTVRGNLISGNDIGVLVEGRLSIGNVIAGNLIGTDATGTLSLKNRLVNVDIADAPANIIGGVGGGDGNVIAGSRVGIFLRGDDATGNLVQGNRIGTNAAGTEKIFNNRGIEIKTSATGNTIGGAGSAGNQISGNTKGVLINSVENNLVLGNLIGTDASGNAALGNVRGVLISGGTNNQIGDERNVISGNVRDGVRIFGAAATGNVVGGNFIGTNSAGDAAIPNRNGILISSNASGNTIGGMTEAARNVISGNSDAGVFLTSDSNSVIGNFIGTDVGGAAAVGNETGVLILRSEGQTIGGTAGSGAGNLISGNSEEGVLIRGGGATANTILGNLIGTDVDGAAALGNKHGVRIESDLNTVGGATPDDGNVISGNTQNGVYLTGAAAAGNMVQSNRIGINAVGTGAVANARSGVLVEDAPNNTIGGIGAGNAIGGNTQQGIRIAGLGATGNLVQGNSIGFDVATVIVIANRDGVRVADGASGNTIGGQAVGEANEVAGNTGRGVWINDGTGNAVTGNSIHNNAALGISIGGQARTPNDPDDPDVGANNLQNFPEIATAVLNGGMLDVEYSIPSHTDNAAFPITVEFFLADSDGEEGETFLGQHSYAAAGTSNASINAGAAGGGSLIVATATDADGNTSEFSAAATVSELLLAADGQASPESGVEGRELTASDLQPIVGAAIDRFVAAGFASNLFDAVEVTIADLPGAALGLATGNTITIDVNAAGHGWFVSPESRDKSQEPEDSDAFSGLSTLDSGHRIDLLTVVMHELGHVAGLDDLHDPDAADDLMYGWLEVGQRKTSLAASIADATFAALLDAF